MNDKLSLRSPSKPERAPRKDVERLMKKGILIENQGTLRLFFDKFVTFVEAMTQDKVVVPVKRDTLSELGTSDDQSQELQNVVEDQNLIVDILATLAASSVDPLEFFRDLVN